MKIDDAELRQAVALACADANLKLSQSSIRPEIIKAAFLELSYRREQDEAVRKVVEWAVKQPCEQETFVGATEPFLDAVTRKSKRSFDSESPTIVACGKCPSCLARALRSKPADSAVLPANAQNEEVS